MDTQTPEELAAQEVEREKMLQESMQAEVIGTVMKKLEAMMDGLDGRQKIAIADIGV